MGARCGINGLVGELAQRAAGVVLESGRIQ